MIPVWVFFVLSLISGVVLSGLAVYLQYFAQTTKEVNPLVGGAVLSFVAAFFLMLVICEANGKKNKG